MRFTIINPLAGRSASTVFIQASGIQTQPLELINGPDNRAPLKVAGFTTKTLGQASPSANSNNTLTATLTTNVALERGTYISIVGLTGSLTLDGPLPLGGPDAAVFSGMHPAPSTLNPTPYTLHPAPYTLRPASYTFNPELYTLHPAPQSLNSTPYTLNPTSYILNPEPYTLLSASYILHLPPCTLHPAPYILHSKP